MKRPIFFSSLILSVMVINNTYAHDTHAALFQLYAEDCTYFIKIKLDRKDLENALSDECLVNMKTLTNPEKNLLIEQYILDRFRVNFDRQPGVYRLASYIYDQDYITVRGVFDTVQATEGLSEITIFNSCLIDKVEKHNNIIQVNLMDRMRSFRLNKDRLQTIIKY